jgi:transposase
MILGIRCSNLDFCFVVLTGTKKSPSIHFQGHIQYPKGFKKPASLKWMVAEVRDLLSKYDIERVVMKGPEPMAKKKSQLIERIEFETAVYIACAQADKKAVFKKVKSTIAKDLGLKGKASYLAKLDTTVLDGFGGLSDKGQEAALAAWTELD